MEPDLEVIQLRPSESFSTKSHGYPYQTVRWHFHPEFEIHQIVKTHGRYFVGDYIGEFEPGNLVLIGPNLPHNWISDVPIGETVDLRCRFIQFAPEFIQGAMNVFPELKSISTLLASSRRGVQFTTQTSDQIRPIMEALVEANGVLRIELFMKVIALLSEDRGARLLASEEYLPDPSGYMTAGMNQAIAYIRENLTQPFDESTLAAISRQSTAAFSRSFRKHTGMSLVHYVRRLRINMACQFLMSNSEMQVSDICFEVGFNNLSNFNRQFLAEKGMSPSQFRKRLAENFSAARAVREGGSTKSQASPSFSKEHGCALAAEPAPRSADGAPASPSRGALQPGRRREHRRVVDEVSNREDNRREKV